MVIADRPLALVEQKLQFIAAQSQEIEGSYEVVDEINFAVIAALYALKEYRMKDLPVQERIASDVAA